jgi:hypothetical protein
LTGAALAQPKPSWDSGEVRPAADSRNGAIPQLRVQKDWTRYSLEYQVSHPARIKDAWIEVWDRSLLLFRQQVSTAGGKMLWEDDTDSPPGNSKLPYWILTISRSTSASTNVIRKTSKKSFRLQILS